MQHTKRIMMIQRLKGMGHSTSQIQEKGDNILMDAQAELSTLQHETHTKLLAIRDELLAQDKYLTDLREKYNYYIYLAKTNKHSTAYIKKANEIRDRIIYHVL